MKPDDRAKQTLAEAGEPVKVDASASEEAETFLKLSAYMVGSCLLIMGLIFLVLIGFNTDRVFLLAVDGLLLLLLLLLLLGGGGLLQWARMKVSIVREAAV